MDVTENRSLLERLTEYTDMVLAAGVIAIIGMMVIPMPPALLDVLLAFNITFSLVVLLTTMYVSAPLQFSVFPGLLLVVTLFRLSLNVASTRLILGEAYAGEVIAAFGNFVVKGKSSRRGRNPQTGDEIEISARRVLTFKPSQILKNALNR